MSEDADRNKREAEAAEKPDAPQPDPPPKMKTDGQAQPKATHVSRTFAYGKPLLSARFDPTGKYLFASGQDYRISRFAFADGKRTDLPGAHESWVRGLAMTPDGKSLLTGGYDGQLVWWPAGADKPEPTRKVAAHDGWVREVAVRPDGKLAATCGNDNLVKLWDIDSGKMVQQLAGHERHVYNMAFHPSEDALISGDLMGQFKHWEISSGKLLREFHREKMHKYDSTFRADIGGARGLGFSPDGKLLAASGITDVSNAFAGVGKPTVELIDWATSQPVRRYVQGGKGVAWGVALHPDNFVVAAYAGSLLFWSYTEAKLHHEAKVGGAAFDLSLHPDGQHLATACHDGKIRISRMAPKPEEEKKPADKEAKVEKKAG